MSIRSQSDSPAIEINIVLNERDSRTLATVAQRAGCSAEAYASQAIWMRILADLAAENASRQVAETVR